MINFNGDFLFTLAPEKCSEICNTINLLESKTEQYACLLKTFLVAVEHNRPHLVKPCWNICCNYWTVRRDATPYLGANYFAVRSKADCTFMKMTNQVLQNYFAAMERYQNPQKGLHLKEKINFLRGLLPKNK